MWKCACSSISRFLGSCAQLYWKSSLIIAMTSVSLASYTMRKSCKVICALWWPMRYTKLYALHRSLEIECLLLDWCTLNRPMQCLTGRTRNNFPSRLQRMSCSLSSTLKFTSMASSDPDRYALSFNSWLYHTLYRRYSPKNSLCDCLLAHLTCNYLANSPLNFAAQLTVCFLIKL